MALTLTTGSAQTVVGASLTPFFQPAASYIVSKDVTGETQYVNTAAALDQPNSVRMAVSSVADIFKGVPGLNPLAGQSRAGISILAQLMETFKVDDAADGLAPYYLPFSAHLVIKSPLDSLITSTVIADAVRRLLGTFLRTNAETLADGINYPLHFVTKR